MGHTPSDLITAIDIITAIHTRDHAEVGFVVMGGAGPEWPASYERSISPGEYSNAWETLRGEVHKKGFADQREPVPVIYRLKEERDELLEALKWVTTQVDLFGGSFVDDSHSTFEKFRALIAKVTK